MPLKKLAQIFRSNPQTIVLDQNQDSIPLKLYTHLNLPTIRCIFDGIIHQGGQGAFERFGVAGDLRQAFWGNHIDGDEISGGFVFVAGGDFVGDFDHIHRLEFGEDQIHFLQEEYVVDQRGDLLDVAGYRFDGSWQLFGWNQPLLHQLQKSACRHKRGAQFVGHIGQEFAPGQLLLRPGMIVSVRVGGQLDRKVMLLPMAAIHQGSSPDELMVYELVTENGRDLVKAKKVALGGVYNNQVEIVPNGSDVQTGSRIVISTAERLSDGAAVRVMQDNTESASKLAEAK